MRLNTNSKPEGTRREGPPFPRNLNTRVSPIHPSNLPLEKRREEEERRRQGEGGGVQSRQKGEIERGRGGEEVFNPNNSQPKRLNYP